MIKLASFIAVSLIAINANAISLENLCREPGMQVAYDVRGAGFEGQIYINLGKETLPIISISEEDGTFLLSPGDATLNACLTKNSDGTVIVHRIVDSRWK